MIELESVLKVLAPHLAAVSHEAGVPVVVSTVKRVPGAWQITYNTEEFLETGNSISGLLGNVPLEVDDDGRIRPLAPGGR